MTYLPRQHEIARRLKVSQMTVSLALRDSNRVSEKTKRKVRAMAKRIGYQVDLTAQRLVSRRLQRRIDNRQVTLDLWVVRKGRPVREEAYLNLIREYGESHPMVRIRTTEKHLLNKPLRDELLVQMAQGPAPAVTVLHDSDFSRFVNLELCANVTSFAESRPESGNISAEQWAAAKRGGHIYGIPFTGLVPTVLFYNRKRFRKAGLNPDQGPLTWNEFAEYGQRLTDARSDLFGMSFSQPYWCARLLWIMIHQAHGQLLRQDGHDWAVALDEKPVLDSLEFLKALLWDFRVAAPEVNRLEEFVMADFARGRTAMYIGEFTPGSFIQMGMDPGDLGVSLLPVWQGGAEFCPAWMVIWVLNRNLPPLEREHAWDFAWHANSPETHIQMRKEILEKEKIGPFIGSWGGKRISDGLDQCRPEWVEVCERALALKRKTPFFPTGWEMDALESAIINLVWVPGANVSDSIREHENVSSGKYRNAEQTLII